MSEADSNDLSALKNRLLHREVRWQGVLKYFVKGRPYIRESFVRADKETKASRVMFYAASDEVKSWEKLEPGASVIYAGSITDVKTTTGLTRKPFAFIDLREVKLVTKESANKAIDSDKK